MNFFKNFRALRARKKSLFCMIPASQRDRTKVVVILHQIASKRSTTCLYVLGTLQMTRSMLENIGFRFAQSQSVLAVFTMGIASKTAYIETYFAGHRKHCRFVFTLLIPCLDTPPNIMTNEWVVQELDFGRAFLL